MFGKKKNTSRNAADPNTKRVYSYYSNSRLRPDEKSDRNRLSDLTDRFPKPGVWWRHTPSILALIAILLSLGYVLSINTDPKIVQLSHNNGVFLQSNSTYQTAANELISKSIFNHNKVTLDVNSISRQLKEQFPELENVSVTVPLINRRPIIYVTASRPALILQTAGTSTLIDNRGVAILPAFQVKNLSKYDLPIVKDESDLDIKLGKPILTSNSVKFLTDVSKQFKAASKQIESLTLPPVPNELDIRLTGQKYYIKMDLTGDSREQVGAYLAVKRKLDSLNTIPTQYFDVRVSGRVFYK